MNSQVETVETVSLEIQLKTCNEKDKGDWKMICAVEYLNFEFNNQPQTNHLPLAFCFL